MACPQCGAAITEGAQFCSRCGQPINAATVGSAEQATFAGTGLQATPPNEGSSSGWLTASDSISHGRFAPGAVLDGRYRIIGLLGRGGMGEVYRADDLRLGQPVALKFLPDQVGHDPVRLAQFHNEVRTARQVSHPNICRVYDIGEVGGQLYLSMEFVAGEDLASSIRRIGRFPEDKAIELARQLCAGLAAAHERGVVHRDLKPANVMLDDAGKVRVMDFGLASVGTVSDVRAGTPAYMAPEQLLGKDVTARSDIYALGLVLYELFTGKRAVVGTTLNELIEHHESGAVTPPSALVSSLDPAIERAILRCLDRDPARRPASALAVAAALPGGDPLAAALAAGETPSPEMVAAAGEGTALDLPQAWLLFGSVILGIVISYALALDRSAIHHLHPMYTPDVLAQKARDAISALGYAARVDEAYKFSWDGDLIGHIRQSGTLTAESLQPSPFVFWYRSSPFAMTGVQFHDDLLTPGVVTPSDPPPIWSGMVQVTLDQQGQLRFLEAIPPQLQPDRAPAATTEPDWSALFTLAGIDHGALQPATPTWNWLAAADTRAAWTGTWPGTSHPMHVEAAAIGGRPVGFLVSGPWTRPWRQSSSVAAGEVGILGIYFVLTVATVIAGAILATRNLRAGRGDRTGALRLGLVMTAALWALWLCEVHVAPSLGLLGNFLVAIVTTVFYGVFFWATYLAVEPFVRRLWPHAMVSWAVVLRGGLQDPVVGRDVLIGATLGVAISLLIRSTALFGYGGWDWASVDFLFTLRAAVGQLLETGIQSVRTAVFLFFMLFLLRALLRRQWAAAAVFAALFGLQSALDSTNPAVDFTVSLVYFGLLAVATVRWGFTTLVSAILVANWLLNVPATSDVSTWYFTHTFVLVMLPLAIAAWAFYRSTGGRLWSGAILP
jgi:serine/threonine-protein kinase